MKNLGEFKTALLSRAGTLDAADPAWVAANDGTDFINEAQDFLVTRALRTNRAGLDLFRELEDRWNAQTQINKQYLDLGTRVLTIDEVYSYDDATTVNPSGPDENFAQRRLLNPISNKSYETYPRSTTSSGDWPTGWRRFEKRLYVVPTPIALFNTWLLIVGRKLPPQLDKANLSSAPILADIWEAPLEDYAAYFLFKRLGWEADAAAALQAGDSSITQVINPRGMERAKGKVRMKIKGMPR